MTASHSLEAELRVLEERLAMPAATESRESLASLLAAEFRESGSSGRIYDLASTLDSPVAGGIRPAITLENFSVVWVGADAVLVTYLSQSISSQPGKPPALRASVWIRRDARWQVLFHQGT